MIQKITIISFISLGLQWMSARPVGDCHFHLLDFLQNGEFYNADKAFPASPSGLMKDGRYFQLPYGERYRRIQGLLDVAEKHDVVDIVVCGMPFVKKWAEDDYFLRPKYYLDSSSRVIAARDSDLQVASAIMDYKVAFKDDAGAMKRLRRLHPFICALDTTDLGAVDLAIKRIREYPGVWEGLGELMSRHDDLTNLTTGERPRADHPSFIRLFKFAGLVGLPVSIHHNVAPISRSENEVKDPYYLKEFKSLLQNTILNEKDPDKRPSVIWCHGGISRRIVVDDYPAILDSLLSDYKENLYIDLSWVVLTTYVYKDLENWTRLISKYPGNFVIGSDSVGKYSGIPREMLKFKVLLNALPEKTRDKVAYMNLKKILNDSRNARKKKGFGDGGITLPHGFKLPETFGLEKLF
ncbi:MAG: hypothetical protein HOD72_01970 [Opitutae bacterium]|jgi:hypothetical protein|nr:hypothetical protein [Opitutae bacterium]MBT4223212.1 hypothetical protein [Opitutae bacterium]MBT5379793.1 hypothetical protein [Opitutae bacterium]MBT5691229.1 hypothetical protein [Opitutae bacterium]MBT6461746.1 hypothetical protein [Opitutae bacterium]